MTNRDGPGLEGLPGRSLETRYARVPLWLFATGVSLQAVAVYAWLHGKYGHFERKFPSYSTLAAELGISKASVINHIRRLKEVGAIAVIARKAREGDRDSNEYLLAFNEPLNEEVVNMLTTPDQAERGWGGQHTDHGGQHTDHGGQHTDPIEDISKKDGLKKRKKSSRRDEDPEFAEWWTRYPKKVGKGAARTAWRKARKKASFEQLMTGLERYINHNPHVRNGYIKNPATWLNQECWLDEVGPVPPTFRGGCRQNLPDRELWNSGKVEVIL